LNDVSVDIDAGGSQAEMLFLLTYSD
jgi:hypothetical protein